MKIVDAFLRASRWNDLAALMPAELTPDTEFSHAELFPAMAATDARNWLAFNALALAVLGGLLPACQSDDDLGGLPPAVRDALVRVAVEQTLEALHAIDEETGGGMASIPGEDAIEARVRRLMDGRL